MSFRPVGDKHAIVEAVFVLQFSQEFSSEQLAAIDDARRNWAFLPGRKKQQVQGLGIALGPSAQRLQVNDMGPSRLGSLEYSRTRADGSKEWMLSIRDDFIAVNCLSYTRWASVWDRARNFLSSVLTAMSKQKMQFEVHSFALSYADQFLWEGEKENYDASQLFKKESSYLASNCFEAGPLWHCYTGWFSKDGLPDPGRLLTRLNIDAREGGQRLSTFLKTELIYSLETPCTRIPQLFGRKGQKSPALIDRCMNYMHTHDKNVLDDLLTEEQTKRISLWASEEE